jgi:tyrosinase
MTALARMHATRREILSRGFVALGSLIASRLDGRTQPAGTRVRAEVHSDAAKPMLLLYKRAVKEMKARPVWDPSSWWFQANLHFMPPNQDSRGCYEASCFSQLFIPPSDASGEVIRRIEASMKLAAGEVSISPDLGVGRDRMWAKCPHASQDFLPWHRVYLLFFERIVESVVGQPFALPYWNYLDRGYRDMPEMFRPERDPDGTENALYYPDRSPLCKNPDDPNVPQAEKPLIRDTDLNWKIAADQKFLERGDVFGLGRGFSFQIESAPHNQVHGRIGLIKNGTPLGMATPALAARDPIFYLHHANLDRLWEWWRTQPVAAGAPNRNPNWIWSLEPYLFSDPNLQKVGLTPVEAGQLIDRAAYTYDFLDPIPTPNAGLVAEQNEGEPVRTSSSAGALTVEDSPASIRLQGAPASGGLAAPIPQNARWYLRLSGVFPIRAPAGVFDIYLDGAESGPPRGPVAGSFSLFGSSQSALTDHAHEGDEIVIEVTERVRALAAEGVDVAQARVMVVPNKAGGALPIRITKFELFRR